MRTRFTSAGGELGSRRAARAAAASAQTRAQPPRRPRADTAQIAYEGRTWTGCAVLVQERPLDITDPQLKGTVPGLRVRLTAGFLTVLFARAHGPQFLRLHGGHWQIPRQG